MPELQWEPCLLNNATEIILVKFRRHISSHGDGLLVPETQLRLDFNSRKPSLTIWVHRGQQERQLMLCFRSTPKGATSFDVHATSAVTVHIIHNPMTKPMFNSRWPLDPDIEVVVTIDVTSKTVNDNKVSSFFMKN